MLTAQDKAWADAMLEAIKANDSTKLARIIAAIHERATACATVRARRLSDCAVEVPCTTARKRSPRT